MMLAIVPARAGSKGIPNKNIYLLDRKPLLQYTLDALLNSNVDDWVISTDSVDIARMFSANEIHIRHEGLAQDDTPMLPVLQSVVEWYEECHGYNIVDSVMLLQPTSPLRTQEDIDKAYVAYKKSKSDSLYSGYRLGLKTKEKTYDKHTSIPHFQRNGAIFITRRDLLDKGRIWSDKVVEFEMPKSRSVDIDDMDDMNMAEAILRFQRERR